MNLRSGTCLSGYRYSDRYSKTEITFSSLLENIQFNTVEGLAIGLEADMEKRFESLKSLEAGAMVRYGFSNYKWNGTGSIKYHFDKKKFGYVSLEGGDDLVQYNEVKPIGPAVNTWYTLLGEKNYMKLFHKQYAKAGARYEVLNGVRLEGALEYSARKAVTNHTDFTFVDEDQRKFTSNNPLDPDNDAPAFTDNNAFKVFFTARIRPRQRYIDRPDGNILLGSKYPTFILRYEKGIDGLAGSDIDYDRMEIGVTDNIRLGMIGKLNYSAWYGKFLNDDKMYFMDFAHFLGNKTFFTGFEERRFDLLDYYTNSTADEYIQAFAEHEFGGFILNKIPLIRKLKLNEIAGFRYLHIPHVDDHMEVSFGLEKLGIFRADYVMSFSEKGNLRSGFVVGIRGIIGR